MATRKRNTDTAEPIPAVSVVAEGAVRTAFGDALNRLGKDAKLPPLSWYYTSEMNTSLLTGHASQGDYSTAEIPDIMRAWADFLGLTPRENITVPGIGEYVGTVDGFAFSVWGVIDNDLFEGKTNK